MEMRGKIDDTKDRKTLMALRRFSVLIGGVRGNAAEWGSEAGIQHLQLELIRGNINLTIRSVFAV